MNNIGQAVLDSVDWSALEVWQGSGDDLRNALYAFLEAKSTEEATDRWRFLEAAAFPQGTLCGAAEPIIDVMMGALADEPSRLLRDWVLEVVRFILNGSSLEDPDVLMRCQERAKRGEWLLVSMLRRAKKEVDKEAILEVLDLIERPFSMFARENLDQAKRP
jgi:hypothetical protein